jgi:hypothetical protein
MEWFRFDIGRGGYGPRTELGSLVSPWLGVEISLQERLRQDELELPRQLGREVKMSSGRKMNLLDLEFRA